jgi:hypothetical protein
MSDQQRGGQLDEVGPVEGGDHRVEVTVDKGEKGAVRDVPRRDHPKLPRLLPKEVAVPEVSVLGDHDPPLTVGDLRDRRVS